LGFFGGLLLLKGLELLRLDIEELLQLICPCRIPGVLGGYVCNALKAFDVGGLGFECGLLLVELALKVLLADLLPLVPDVDLVKMSRLFLFCGQLRLELFLLVGQLFLEVHLLIGQLLLEIPLLGG
jgi:hypothetical protein